jgi:hypothetical protein
MTFTNNNEEAICEECGVLFICGECKRVLCFRKDNNCRIEGSTFADDKIVICRICKVTRDDLSRYKQGF